MSHYTVGNLSDFTIESVQIEAGDAGDFDMVRTCDAALWGDESAKEEICDVLNAGISAGFGVGDAEDEDVRFLSFKGDSGVWR